MDLPARSSSLRVDINVPVEDGKVTDATRIERVVPTIKDIRKGRKPVILLAHFGRPKGKPNPDVAAPPCRRLEDALGSITFTSPPIASATSLEAARNGRRCDLLLENTRFHAMEEANDRISMARSLASLGDIFVNDAFSAAHRAHASTEGVARLLPACAGPHHAGRAGPRSKRRSATRSARSSPLSAARRSPPRSTCSPTSWPRSMHLVIGGGMANTFLAAKGVDVGKSLCEHDLADTAAPSRQGGQRSGCTIVLPVDIVVAREFKAGADNETVPVDAMPADAMILDVGPQTVAMRSMAGSPRPTTLVWNGPLGAFEIPPFDAATVAAAKHAAEPPRLARCVSVAGGGDTVSALNHAGVTDDFTYVSTAGGAFLEWMEGKPLPGVDALKA
jgi:phosphoglycerate kinase